MAAEGVRESAVRGMVLLCLTTAATAALSWLLPISDRTPVRLGAVATAAALAAAWAVHRLRTVTALHAGVAAHVLGLTASVALSATGTGATAGALGFVWVSLYAAFFLGRTASRAYAGAIAVGLAAALAVNPFPGASRVWLLLAGTTALASEAVAGVVDRLHAAARTDPLTGVLNRSGLQDAAEQLLAAAQRSGRPLTLAVADLDGFKQVNDRHGHAAGDRLLVELVRGLLGATRAADVLGRLGGDEFCLVLPDTPLDRAAELVQRWQALSPQPWSVGLAEARDGDDLDALLLRADRELYVAKSRRTAGPAPRREAPVLHEA